MQRSEIRGIGAWNSRIPLRFMRATRAFALHEVRAPPFGAARFDLAGLGAS
jgi:hypothetical protein